MTISIRPKLLPAGEYLQDLIKRINQASERVAIVTTIFHNDSPRMEEFTEALCMAARRGVDVSFCVDTYTYLEPSGPWRQILRDQPVIAHRALFNERRLKNAGVKFRWLGRHANFGVMGRTHIKWSIVDDTIYSFGGVNLYEMGVQNADYMFRINSHELAKKLFAQHQSVIQADRANRAGKNRSLVINNKTQIIFDGGIPFNSRIHRRAIELAKQAKKIVFVSQYCPTGRLAKALRAKKAKVYFNHWESADSLNIFVIKAGMRTSRLETLYKREPYLHAKFIIYTMPDGSKTALTGSHNFQAGGVALGTRELCVETTSSQFINELEDFFKKYVR